MSAAKKAMASPKLMERSTQGDGVRDGVWCDKDNPQRSVADTYRLLPLLQIADLRLHQNNVGVALGLPG